MKKQGRPSEYESTIASIVKEAPRGTHLTAPEVFSKARELGLPVSISTVYRTLQRLKAGGNLSTVSGDRKLRYESAGKGPEHDHLICLVCGLTIEFVDQRLPIFGQAVAKRKGFLHSKSRFDVLGFCENCQMSDKDTTNVRIKEHWRQAAMVCEEALKNIHKLLAQREFTDENLDALLTESRKVCDNLKKALDNCESASKLFG